MTRLALLGGICLGALLGAAGCVTAAPVPALPAGVAGFVSTQGVAPALDGSLKGWEAAPEARFELETNKIAVRGQYDGEAIYIRWELQKDWQIAVIPLYEPVRLFTHDRLADTLSFYLRGDAGDMRLIFTMVTDDEGTRRAVVLGTFPTWSKPGAMPMEYWSPVRTEQMQHVALLEEATLGYKLEDEDRRLILVARLPVTALNFNGPITPGWQTRGDFEATLGGSQKFWWSGNAEFGATFVTDEPSEATLYQKGWKSVWFLKP